jgi:hypothetical protein
MLKFKQFSEAVIFSDIKKSNRMGYDKILGKNIYTFLGNAQKQKQVFKPFGNIGGTKVFQFIEKNTGFHYAVIEGEKVTMYLETKKYGPVSQQVAGVAAKGNSLKVKDLYKYLVMRGIDLMSDIMQSEGGYAIWKSLSKERGITVFGWDGQKMHNLGSKLDDYTEMETHARQGEQFDDEETAKQVRKMVLVATKK